MDNIDKNMWAVKGTGGYKLYGFTGIFMSYPGMAADCKAYAQWIGRDCKVINDKSSERDIERYERATGKKYYSSKKDSNL